MRVKLEKGNGSQGGKESPSQPPKAQQEDGDTRDLRETQKLVPSHSLSILPQTRVSSSPLESHTLEGRRLTVVLGYHRVIAAPGERG